MTNTWASRRFAGRLAVSLTVAVAAVVFAAACSNDSGTELAVDETTTTTTAAPVAVETSTTADVESAITVDDEYGHTRDEPEVAALTMEDLAAVIAETNPTPVVEVVEGSAGMDGPVVPTDVGPTPLPPVLDTEPVVVTTPSTTTAAPAETTATTEPEREPLPPSDPIPEESERFLVVDPLGPDLEWGATEPVVLRPGESLTTTATFAGIPFAGAEIIGFVDLNNSAQEVFMYVCIDNAVLTDPAWIEGVDGYNVVGSWRVADTDTPDTYRLLHEPSANGGGPSTFVFHREQWESFVGGALSLIDVSGCW